MTEFEVDDNFITENIPIEAMTDDELLKNRDYIYGTYRNKNYLNQIDQEIKDRGLGSPSWQQDDAEYEKQFEVNTSYDQDKDIGEIPSAYFAHSQPMNAKNGDNFMSIQRLDEGNPNHDKSDGKFTSGSGGSASSSTDNDGISQKVMSKYPQLDKEFVDEQIDESVGLREKATKSNNEMQNDFNKNLDNVVVSGRVKGIDSMIGKLARKPE